MPASTSKTVLFSVSKSGNKTVQWPVAVFNSDKDAKGYATILKVAYRTEDVDAVRSLDANVKLTPDDKLLPGVKFALLTLPYAPTPEIKDDDQDEIGEIAA